ncbi:hypothetical protein [Roseibium polysiphoniae]|uniref:Uncharacterized protein n=1 Tax=Roseibium polysiphoniae TaxID=2571221 RepID=A0ABR9C699_9HYPH|nr:hypothetical protein [Roseibium polysiphoniae]MBD8875415.1 hypothetical protein [Roseibium polysiphoniae]
MGKPDRHPFQTERQARLEAGLDVAADLVLRFGEEYLAFFIKLERELLALNGEQDALGRVMRRRRI